MQAFCSAGSNCTNPKPLNPKPSVRLCMPSKGHSTLSQTKGLRSTILGLVHLGFREGPKKPPVCVATNQTEKP